MLLSEGIKLCLDNIEFRQEVLISLGITDVGLSSCLCLSDQLLKGGDLGVGGVEISFEVMRSSDLSLK